MIDVSKLNESGPQQPDPTAAGEPANSGDSQIKQLLRCVATGKQASEAAYLALKAELKVIAEQQMKRADHLSLEASHVVNQVFVELAGNPEISWQDREHFLAYACEELLRLDDVLPALERDHPELAAVVYFHFFGGLSFERIAPLLDINPGTASRRWLKARTIMHRGMTQTS